MTEEIEYEVTDRYEAMGIKPPGQLICCRGQCEATGFVPVEITDDDPRLIDLWLEAEQEMPSDDGWHFVRCPDCNGTGRQQGWKPWIIMKNLPRVLRQKARFARNHLFSSQTWRTDVPHWRWFNVRIVLRILIKRW